MKEKNKIKPSNGVEALTQNRLIEFVNDAIANVPYYNRIRNGKPVTSLEEMPLLNADILAKHSLPGSREFIRGDLTGGYIFSSSGSSGKPKYSVYSIDEFDTSCGLLAKGFRGQGLKPGDVVANLFMAGNMWSSFLAVERGLRHLQVIQLPIGGGADADLILKYLDLFKPRAVFGIPTTLISLAQRSREKEMQLNIPIVFYAGEHLNLSAQKTLAENWKTEKIHSAGYASVDAGPVGYQCPYCEHREHHLYSDYTHMEIIDGEAVITSVLRRNMPFIRLRTGDVVERVEYAPCPCGSSEPKFILMGRCDGQMKVWGGRAYINDIELALNENGIPAPMMQIRLTTTKENVNPKDIMTILVEGEQHTENVAMMFKKNFYTRSKDINGHKTFEWVNERMVLEMVPTGSIPRLKRTGKIKSIVDERS